MLKIAIARERYVPLTPTPAPMVSSLRVSGVSERLRRYISPSLGSAKMYSPSAVRVRPMGDHGMKLKPMSSQLNSGSAKPVSASKRDTPLSFALRSVPGL